MLSQHPRRDERCTTATFAFAGLGTMAALGHHCGVAQILGLRQSGFFAWLVWRAVCLGKLPGLDLKVRVEISWILDLFFAPGLVQLRMGHEFRHQ